MFDRYADLTCPRGTLQQIRLVGSTFDAICRYLHSSRWKSGASSVVTPPGIRLLDSLGYDLQKSIHT